MKRLFFIAVLCLVFTATPAIAADLATYQTKLQKLYNELLSIKQTQEFAQMGFGPGNKRASTWNKETFALRDAMDKEKLPYQVQDSAQALINLGSFYLDARKSGFKNVMMLHAHEETTYTLRRKVEDAIAFNPVEDAKKDKGRIIDTGAK